MRRLRFPTVLSRLPLLLTIAGGSVKVSAETTLLPVVMQLDWIYNAQFAGLFQAVEQGFYTDAGLEVEIRPTNREQTTVERVLAEEGLALGSGESNILLSAHAQGAPIVALATMFQHSPMGWMFLTEKGYTDFTDLAGQRVGVHPDGEKVVRLAAAATGTDLAAFTLPHVGYSLDPLLAGEIDAMQAYIIDEFVALQQATDGNARILLAKDYGYQAYSQVFFTSTEDRATYPEEIAAFLKASLEGWAYAFAHPEDTIELICTKYNPKLDPAYQLASLHEIEQLMRAPDGSLFAPMDPAVWSASQEAFLKVDLLKAPADLEALLDFSLNP